VSREITCPLGELQRRGGRQVAGQSVSRPNPPPASGRGERLRLVTKTRASAPSRGRKPAGTYETIDRTVSENRPSVSYGQPTHWRISANGGAAYDLKLDRDVLGRITRHVELLDGTTRAFDYAYDETGRLSSVEVDSVKTSAPPVSSTTSPSGAGIFVEAAAGPRRCVAEAT
jgi:hypothetical protein